MKYFFIRTVRREPQNIYQNYVLLPCRTSAVGKKTKPMKNNKNNTVAAAKDVSVSLGDTGITVTNTNTHSANGAFTIYLPSTTLRQHLCE